MQEHPVPRSRFNVVACNVKPTYNLVWKRNMAVATVRSPTMGGTVDVISKKPAYQMVRLDRFTMA